MKDKLVKVVQTHQFAYWGPYLICVDMDPVFCKKLLKQSKSLKVKHNKHLAGQIQHERLFDWKKNPWIQEGLQVYIDTWIEGFKHFTQKFNFTTATPKITSLWVNYQKPGEFNPVHVHTEADLSFVLWLQVPKKILQEPRDTTATPPGWISFLYGEDNWAINSTKHYEPKENKILVFPATLRHEVMAFKSKVTRISVAGNFTLFR